jgi:hypothetical protein
MVLKERYEDGHFVKMKARLVANGRICKTEWFVLTTPH